MNKAGGSNNQTHLLITGFALLLPGIALATLLDVSRVFQIIGLILILAASAFFGASINARNKHKK